MNTTKATLARNRLLATLSPEDYALLQPHLTVVELTTGQVLIEPGEDIQHSWFIDFGIASVVAGTVSGDQSEVGLIGWDGMVDVSAIHSLNRSMLRCFVQAPGSARRMGVTTLQDALQRSTTLRSALLRHAHAFLVQVAGTALANASLKVEERLARWLLMYHDRSNGNELSLTHEILGLMLNVRRAGVTSALKALQTANIISMRRGSIIISDRPALEAFAGDGYGQAEKLGLS